MRATGPDAKTRGLVMARDGGRCRRCGAIGEQIHHRLPRGMGGTRDKKINSPANLVLVCGQCHAEIESDRLDAYDTGWLVRRGYDPAGIYLVDRTGLTFCLLDDGTTVTDPPIPESFYPADSAVPF
jgi:5-methylcytosine-specific restriction protein A